MVLVVKIIFTALPQILKESPSTAQAVHFLPERDFLEVG